MVPVNAQNSAILGLSPTIEDLSEMWLNHHAKFLTAQ